MNKSLMMTSNFAPDHYLTIESFGTELYFVFDPRPRHENMAKAKFVYKEIGDMEWSKFFEQTNQPTLEDMDQFVNNSLWQGLNSFLQDSYHVWPRLTYSKCSMQKGWNLKYQKSGKSLCVLYPMPGYFIALVVVGEKEMSEAEFLMPFCSEYTKTLFTNTKTFNGAKWMMIEVGDEQVLEDIKSLIALRVKSKKIKS